MLGLRFLLVVMISFSVAVSAETPFRIELDKKAKSDNSSQIKNLSKLETELPEFVSFIEEWSGYKYNGETLPKIKFLRQDYVQIYSYGDFEVAQAEKRGEKLPTVNAVYDRISKTIFVSNRLAADSDLARIAVLHEAVHFLQDITGYTDSLGGHIVCTESEAYDIQMLWQIINKVREEDVPSLREHSLLAAMKCMGNQFEALKNKGK